MGKKIVAYIVLVMMSLAVYSQTVNYVLIDGLYYNIDQTNHTAQVTFFQNDAGNYPGLTSVVIPDSVEYESVMYPVTSIGTGAFMYCSSLTSITIGSNVQTVENMAFLGCMSLSSIIFTSATPPTMDGMPFIGLNTGSIQLTVPPGSESQYGSSWGDFDIPAPVATCTITIESDDETQGKVQLKQ